MPSFSIDSITKLRSCHRDLQVIFFDVIETFDCTVLEGFRGEEAQNKAFADGKSKLKWPNGNHNKNPSMAIDVSPYPIDWKDKERFIFFAGYVLGIARKLKDINAINHSLRWGGDWDNDTDLKDNVFNDLVHFELIPIKE